MTEKRARLDESFSGRNLKKGLSGDLDVQIDLTATSLSPSGNIQPDTTDQSSSQDSGSDSQSGSHEENCG